MSANKFVFVVCGSREHIDTLHYSLRCLKHFAKNEILVVTDSSRNEIPVVHDAIVDVKTPEAFNHHQASIYLKVGLNKFLPKGFLYCYLDSDVVAISTDCDLIFAEKKGLVTFAPDHCRMPKFSPNAVRCGCLTENKKDMAELEALMEIYDPARKLIDPAMDKKKRALIKKFEIIKQNKLSYLGIVARFFFSYPRFKLDEDTFYDKRKKLWLDNAGSVIISPAENMFKDIEKNSKWKWSSITRRWYGPNGQDVFNLECTHLPQYIKERFGINVTDTNFQHWNGGVFLFDDSSEAFLNAWFDKTMKIFDFPEWLTRDQGTLIATAWEFGLQNNPTLPKRFNFIADYTSNPVMMDEQGNFSDDAFKTKIRPAFVHIYHNFGLKGWDIWDYVDGIAHSF